MLFSRGTEYKNLDKELLDDVTHLAVKLFEASSSKQERGPISSSVSATTTALAHQVFLRACELNDYRALPVVLDDDAFKKLPSAMMVHPAPTADSKAAVLVDSAYKHYRGYQGSGIFTSLAGLDEQYEIDEGEPTSYLPFKLAEDCRLMSARELLIDFEKRGRMSTSFIDPAMIELFDYIDSLDRKPKSIMLSALKANLSLVGALINLDAIDYSPDNWSGDAVAVLNRGKLCVSQSCFNKTLENSPKYREYLQPQQ